MAATRNEDSTLKLRRYILGLAATAFTHSPSGYLRQGCNLVLDPDKPRDLVEVYNDGRRAGANLTHDDALEYAKAVAKDFGVGPNREVSFDKELAKRDVSGGMNGNATEATPTGRKPRKR